jgi:hypothetical protein
MATTPTHSELRSFYAAIGRFILMWADVENYLDLFVLMIRKPTDHRLPHQLAGKIKFVRDRLQFEQTANAPEALKIIDEIDGLANTRHDYIHGGRIGHSIEGAVLFMKLGRWLQPPNRPRRKTVQVSAAEVEEITDRLRELGSKMLDLLERTSQNRRHTQK